MIFVGGVRTTFQMQDSEWKMLAKHHFFED